MKRATFIVVLIMLCGWMDPAQGQLFQRTPCEDCSFTDRLFPKRACKRCERKMKKEAEKEAEEKTKEAELKKLEAEAKKAELEAKKLEEEDKERNKPWDIADDENLENGDLLKMAAMTKKDQDLAPKKQQALDYLASIGCNKDPKVQKAVLAGLKDHNVDVRKTAVQAVIYAMQGPAGLEYPTDPFAVGTSEVFADGTMFVGTGCGCSQNFSDCSDGVCPAPAMAGGSMTKMGDAMAPPMADGEAMEKPDCPACELVKQKELAKEMRKQMRKQAREDRKMNRQNRCQHRRRGDCSCEGDCSCSYESDYIDGVPCEDCSDCAAGDGGCRSCCSKEIRAELEKMAFDPDPDRVNCFYEPSLEVRNLALQAYSMCPGKKPEEEVKEETDAGAAEPTGKAGAEAGSTEPGVGDSTKPTTSETDDAYDSDDSESTEESGASETTGDASASIIDSDPNMLRGRVRRFLRDGYEIQYSREFQIPSGNSLYVTDGDRAHVATVVSSGPGTAVVTVANRFDQPRSATIQMGVMR